MDSIWHCYSILEVSPTESKLGFGMSVVRAGVGIFIVMLMLGDITGENINQNTKPLCYTRSWKKCKK